MFKGIGDLQDTGIADLLIPIVEHHKIWGGDLYQLGRVKRLVPGKNLIFLCRVEQVTERHVGVPGGLVLVKVQLEVHQKSHIVFHVHVHGIFQGHHSQFLWGIVRCSIYRVVKA